MVSGTGERRGVSQGEGQRTDFGGGGGSGHRGEVSGGQRKRPRDRRSSAARTGGVKGEGEAESQVESSKQGQERWSVGLSQPQGGADPGPKTQGQAR